MFPGKTYICPFYHQLRKNTCICFSLLMQIIRVVPFPLCSLSLHSCPCHSFHGSRFPGSGIWGLASAAGPGVELPRSHAPARWGPPVSLQGTLPFRPWPWGFLTLLADEAWSLSACGASWRRRKGVFRQRCRLTQKTLLRVATLVFIALQASFFSLFICISFFRSVSHDQRSTLVSCLSSSSSSPSIISLFCLLNREWYNDCTVSVWLQ